MRLFSINKKENNIFINIINNFFRFYINLFKEKNNNIKRKNFKIILTIVFIILAFVLNENNYFKFEKKCLVPVNKFYLKNNDNYNMKYIIKYFNVFDLKYFYSFKFNIIRIEYKIGLYNNENKLILPSDVILYKNLHLVCFIEIINKNNSTTINTLPNIYQNNLYKCTEFFKLNEKIKIGIKIYQNTENEEKLEETTLYFLDEKAFNYDTLTNKLDKIFDFLVLDKEYRMLVEKMNNKNINETLRLKKSYIKYPFCFLKRFSIENENLWKFSNLFNEYFCFCIGFKCINIQISQKCKYYLYLNIIDNNRNIYQKTDSLFIDFIFKELSSDDAYPVFKKMLYQNLPVHYITENIDIYNKFCYLKNECLTIIPVNKLNYTINGDFLEKYLTLILKLKQVISGGGIYFNYINNLFYNIEYITYISITHGVCYFKYFLYEDYACYGKKRVDKILIPPSEKIITVAKQYGWKDNDIIKLNLPKWDKYNQNINISSEFEKKEKFRNNSIFILFTWRDIYKKKEISYDYFKNILNLLNNDILIKNLKKNNILLYFSIHHKINEYNKYKRELLKNEYIKFVENKEISECLTKTSLVVTDFSSVIFDLIYKRKPFILYIPDANDPKIEDNYVRKYYELIQSLKNGTIEFENKYFDIKGAINKIIYYINNNFCLDQKLKKFYDNLGIKSDININKFIDYLINLI